MGEKPASGDKGLLVVYVVSSQSDCEKQVPFRSGTQPSGGEHRRGMPVCFAGTHAEGAADILDLVTETPCKILPYVGGGSCSILK